jgi:ABC-type sugar transport system substrate-binding protein
MPSRTWCAAAAAAVMAQGGLATCFKLPKLGDTLCVLVPFLQVGWRSRLGATADAAMNSMAVALLFDLADAALYFLDIITDIKVMQVGAAAQQQAHSWHRQQQSI